MLFFLIIRRIIFNFEIYFRNAPKDTVRPTSVDTSVETETGPPVLPRRPGRPPLGLKRKQGDTSTSPNKKKHKQMRKDHPKSHVTPEAIVGQSGTADKDVCYFSVLFLNNFFKFIISRSFSVSIEFA